MSNGVSKGVSYRTNLFSAALLSLLFIKNVGQPTVARSYQGQGMARSTPHRQCHTDTLVMMKLQQHATLGYTNLYVTSQNYFVFVFLCT